MKNTIAIFFSMFVLFTLLALSQRGTAKAQIPWLVEHKGLAEVNDTQAIYLPLVVTHGPPDGMVFVPSGEFQMGCHLAHNGGYDCWDWELPLHTVYLDAYYIDKYEVTNAQYAAFLNQRGSNDCNGYECINMDDPDRHILFVFGQYVVETGYENHPVIEVTWYGSESYCQAGGKRLPTEAEWEKAARGKTIYAFPWGDNIPDCSLTNFNYCIGGETSLVGSYPSGASPYGALDMAGNVWEWVNDWYLESYYSTYPVDSWPPNPTGPTTGTCKMLRGGSWDNSGLDLRVASRTNWAHPYSSNINWGFRCVSAP